MEPSTHEDEKQESSDTFAHETSHPSHFSSQNPFGTMNAQSQPSQTQAYASPYAMPQMRPSRSVGTYPMPDGMGPQLFERVPQFRGANNIPAGLLHASSIGPAAMRRPSQTYFEPAGYSPNTQTSYRPYQRQYRHFTPSSQQFYDERVWPASAPVMLPQYHDYQQPRYAESPFTSTPYTGFHHNQGARPMPFQRPVQQETLVPGDDYARHYPQASSVIPTARDYHRVSATMAPTPHYMAVPVQASPQMLPQQSISWNQVIADEVLRNAGFARGEALPPHRYEQTITSGADHAPSTREEIESAPTCETDTSPPLGPGFVEQESLGGSNAAGDVGDLVVLPENHATINPRLIQRARSAGSDAVSALVKDREEREILSEEQQILPSQSKADNFVDLFRQHAKSDTKKIATFNALCQRYSMRELSAEELYTEMYSLLHSALALHLLPGFLELLPPQWRDADLAWLNQKIEDNISKSKQSASSNTSHAQPLQGRPEVDSGSKRKKKRPINGFRASDPQNEEELGVITSNKLPESPRMSSKARASAIVAEGENSSLPGDAPRIQLPVKYGKTDPINLRRIADAARKHAPAKISKEMLKKRPRYTFGQTDPAEIPHVGPVFSSRRTILARSSRPYIHAHCGKRFVHPQEVVQHHNGKKGKCVNEDFDRPWNEHPSCHVSYPELNFAKCKGDRYVILDQKSLHKIDAAIAAGLKDAGEIDEEAEADPEQDSDHEAESDQFSDPVPTKSRKRAASIAEPMTKKAKEARQGEDADATVRAAALSLRKRK